MGAEKLWSEWANRDEILARAEALGLEFARRLEEMNASAREVKFPSPSRGEHPGLDLPAGKVFCALKFTQVHS